MSGFIDELSSGDLRRSLIAMRDRLAVEMAPVEHIYGCPCECGAPKANGRDLAALAQRLADVLDKIDRLPGGEVKSDLDLVADRIAAGVIDLTQRRADRRAAGADPSGS